MAINSLLRAKLESAKLMEQCVFKVFTFHRNINIHNRLIEIPKEAIKPLREFRVFHFNTRLTVDNMVLLAHLEQSIQMQDENYLEIKSQLAGFENTRLF